MSLFNKSEMIVDRKGERIREVMTCIILFMVKT